MTTTDNRIYTYGKEVSPCGEIDGRVYGVPRISADGSPQRVFSSTEEARPDSLDSADDLSAHDSNINFSAHLRACKFDCQFEDVFGNKFDQQPTRFNKFGGTPEITSVDGGTSTYTVTDPYAGAEPFFESALVLVSGVSTVNNGLRLALAGSNDTTLVVDGTNETVATVPDDAEIKVVGMQFPAGDLSYDATAKTLTSAAGLIPTANLSVGDWIKIGGDAEATRFGTLYTTTIPAAADAYWNNDFVRIVAIDANVITFDRTLDMIATDAGAGRTIQLFFGERINYGTGSDYLLTTTRWQILQPMVSGNDVITHILGAQTAFMEITGEARGRLNVTFGIMGRDFDDVTAADMNANSIIPEQHPALMSGLSGQRAFFGDSMNLRAISVASSSIRIDPTLLPVDAEGVRGYAGFDPSTRTATLTGSMKFRDRTIFDAHASETTLDFARIMTDKVRAYVVEMPGLQITSFQQQDSGRGQHVTADFSCKATPIAPSATGMENFVQLIRFKYAPGVNFIKC